MAKRSFIYRNIFIYRLMMDVLYLGRYKKRFDPITGRIATLNPGARILELCFGDTHIADFCKKRGYKWTGLDINPDFVETAQRMGFNAQRADLTTVTELPKADLCIMMGSLYHFHKDTLAILNRIFAACPSLLLSEPVLNLSTRGGFIGFLARKGANAGKGNEHFRYNRDTLMGMLRENAAVVGYEITEIVNQGKDLVVKLKRNANR